MKRALALLAALGLSACGGGGGSSPPPVVAPPPAPPTGASAWIIEYSPGMPPSPTPDGAGGWYFDFPDCGGAGSCGVHYVVAPTRYAAHYALTVSARVTYSGVPELVYKLQPDNVCDAPAKAHLFIQRVGDDLSGAGPMEFYRWWSTPDAIELTEGESTVGVPFTPDRWVSVLGKRGDTDATTSAGFQSAITNIGAAGLTFGGGCFYGHGVNVINGGVRFNLTSFSLQ